MRCGCCRRGRFTAHPRRDRLFHVLRPKGTADPMRFFPHIFLCLAALLIGAPAQADDLSDKQPSFTRIAGKCGGDASMPSYSSADYAKAMADAAKAIKSATKDGSRARITAIQNSVARLKECMDEETRKFILPSINNCADFLNEYKSFSARADLLMRTGKITAEDRARAREMFRKPAMDCVRHMMTMCIDPTNRRTVDFVINVMKAAAEFEFILSYGRKTGLEGLLITKDPSKPKMTFCTDTDYACRGDKAACNRRINQIKAIMQTYLDG